MALIFSGHTLKYFSNMRKNLGPRVDGWPISLKDMTSILVVPGLVITGVYWGVNRFVIDTSSMQRKKKVGPGRFSTILVPAFMDLSLTIL